MRISDWSSDVCSSDLPGQRVVTRKLVDLALRPFLFGQVGAAAAETLKIAERIADRLARYRPPALLARHRGAHRQFVERRTRRQAEAQRALLILVIADPLLDDLGKGPAEQVVQRPPQFGRDGQIGSGSARGGGLQ